MARNEGPEIITTIYPQTLAIRKLPVNLKQDHRQLFAHELQRTIPPSRLLRFKNIRVSSDGILFSGTRILPESFAFPHHRDEWKLRSTVKFLAANQFVRHRRRIEAEVLWITDYWSKAYFHWLADALTRLFVVQDRLDQLVLTLPGEYEGLHFVAPTLKAFGVKRVEFIKPNEVLECRSLLMPTHTAPPGHYNPEVIHGVREVLLSAFGAAGADERIYISRRNASKRKIVNETEITDVLRRFEFQIVCAEELSFQEQVRTFSRARHLVSNHGAGLTNMLFMKDGGSVLELRHQSDCINNCYFTLSSALNLKYFFQACEPSTDGPDPHTADLIVDPHELENNLTLMLEQ